MKVMGQGSLSSAVTGVINVGWYGAMALLALSACLLVIAPFVDPPRLEVQLSLPAALAIDSDAHEVASATPDFEHVYLDALRGSVKFSPRSSGAVISAAFILMVTLGVIVWILGQLRAVFQTLRAGKPFVAANATRIRRIGYVVIAGEIARSVVVYLAMRYTMTHFSIQGLRFEARPDLNIVAILCGAIIVVIAEVFREGTRLDEEQSLTV